MLSHQRARQDASVQGQFEWTAAVPSHLAQLRQRHHGIAVALKKSLYTVLPTQKGDALLHGNIQLGPGLGAVHQLGYSLKLAILQQQFAQEERQPHAELAGRFG